MEHLGQFIMNHWELWLVLMVILLLTFINELITQKQNAKALSPQAVVDLMNNEHAVVLDIRDKEAYKIAHIIDAQNIKGEDLAQQKMDKYKNKPIILVCARGIESQAVAKKLRAKGHNSMILSGGIAAWQNAGLPLVKGKG